MIYSIPKKGKTEFLPCQKKRGREGASLFKEIRAEKFPNLRRDLDILNS